MHLSLFEREDACVVVHHRLLYDSPSHLGITLGHLVQSFAEDGEATRLVGLTTFTFVGKPSLYHLFHCLFFFSVEFFRVGEFPSFEECRHLGKVVTAILIGGLSYICRNIHSFIVLVY